MKRNKESEPALRVHQVRRLDQIVNQIVVKGWQKLSGSGCRSSSTHVLQGVAPAHRQHRPHIINKKKTLNPKPQ